jgi:hypothetical protein
MLREWSQRYQANPKETLQELDALLSKERSTLAWINSQSQISDHLDPMAGRHVLQDGACATSLLQFESIPPSFAPRSLSPVPSSVADYEDYALHLQQKRLITLYNNAGKLWGSVQRDPVNMNADQTMQMQFENACHTVQNNIQRLQEYRRIQTQMKTGTMPAKCNRGCPHPSCRGAQPAQLVTLKPCYDRCPMSSKPSRIFNASLTSYRKNDLREIASAFGLDYFGLKKDLMDRIRIHMNNHPELGDDQRFRALFARRKRST